MTLFEQAFTAAALQSGAIPRSWRNSYSSLQLIPTRRGTH